MLSCAVLALLGSQAEPRGRHGHWRERQTSLLAPDESTAQLVSGQGNQDKRPVAYMIGAEARFTKERRDLLEAIGFRPERVDPVYLDNDCSGGTDNSKQKAMWGITNAHFNAMRRIVQTGQRGLIMESDWGVGDQKVEDLRATMAKAAARDEHYVAVGWCRNMHHETTEPWHFTCATAYFLSVEAATNFTRLRTEDNEHHLDRTPSNGKDAPCFPVDSMLVGACKDRSNRWKEWGIRLEGRCCWWPGSATNRSVLNFPGYGSSQRGMFQQDRDTYESTHSDGGSEFDEEDEEDELPAARGKTRAMRAALRLYASSRRARTREHSTTRWYRLNPPALCGEPTWGVPGARDPAAAAGAVKGYEANPPSAHPDPADSPLLL